MDRSHKILLALALLLAAASILLSAVLFSRTADQQAGLDKQQTNVCKVQGVTFAGILANLGLALQEAVFLEKHARDPQVRSYYKAVAPALRMTLDQTFKKPPRCGEKFEFTIQIEGEKRRHVVTK